MSENKVWRYHWHIDKATNDSRSPHNQNDCEWGTLMVDNNGCVAIIGDYANGTAKIHFNEKYWRNLGDNRDFRTELARCNGDYLAEKMFYRDGRELDVEATAQGILEHLIIGDDGPLNADPIELNLYEEFKESGDFDAWYAWTSIDDAQEFQCMKYKGDVEATINLLWPEFRRMIREELAAEKAVAVD